VRQITVARRNVSFITVQRADLAYIALTEGMIPTETTARDNHDQRQ